MDIKIISTTEKPLFDRTEVIADLGFEKSTPKRSEARQKVADSLKVKTELVIVKEIKPAFGERKARLTANVYKSKEALENFEQAVIKNRNAPKKKEGEEAPAEKEEALKEEKKEEKPAEKKEAK
ncbi:hypothetical protein JXB11_02110 [Candidatus Woesearchaeota archaeon]|nr:hypothetical protein [Candidatus Woesearchaeota archaeon]